MPSILTDRRVGHTVVTSINIAWPRQEVYDPDSSSPVLQFFAVIFVAITLVAGFFAYRVVTDRDGAPDPVDALVRKNKK